MRLIDIYNRIDEASLEVDSKRILRDALISLKVNGVEEIHTHQILQDVAASGIQIGMAELLGMLNNDPMVKTATKDKVIFSQDMPELPKVDADKKEADDKRAVDHMARSAIKLGK